MDFQNYIRAVGTGPKSNRELDPVEVKDCINQILKQEIKSERIVAFLLGWRVNLETSSELSAGFKACEDYIKRVNINESIELGYAYDGKNQSPYLFPLYGKYLKKFGLDLIISGDYLQPAKGGVTTKDLCEKITLDDNIHFFDRQEFFKELSDLTELRNILGLRSAFNTIEKLLNPANSKYAITAAFHKPYVAKYHEMFGENYENLLVLKGKEGAPEFFTKCKYWAKEDGEIIEHVIDPSEYGISYEKTWENMTVEQMIEEISNPSESLDKLVRLNVAVLLVAANKASDVKTAYEML